MMEMAEMAETVETGRNNVKRGMGGGGTIPTGLLH